MTGGDAATQAPGAPDLSGHTIAVVGGSRGIGLAVACDLARHGARVVVSGRDATAVDAATATVDAAATAVWGTDGAAPVAVGVAGGAQEPGVAERLLEVATAGGADVSGLIVCAGVAEPSGSSILTVTDEEWLDLLDCHLQTLFRSAKVFAPHLVERGGGAIVATSSFAFLGEYGGTGYPAGKGAVNALTAAMAAELSAHGVRVNAVCPGARTRLSTGDDYERQIADLHERGLLDEFTRDASLDPAPPEYVAPLYTCLVSDFSAGVTGRLFAGAGGFVGEFPKPAADVLAYRDFHDSPPWTAAELAAMIPGAGA